MKFYKIPRTAWANKLHLIKNHLLQWPCQKSLLQFCRTFLFFLFSKCFLLCVCVGSCTKENYFSFRFLDYNLIISLWDVYILNHMEEEEEGEDGKFVTQKNWHLQQKVRNRKVHSVFPFYFYFIFFQIFSSYFAC